MAASPWTVPTANRLLFFNGGFLIDAEVYKMALFLSSSNLGLGSTTYAGLTSEHANANGYTTGGRLLTLTLTGGTIVVSDILGDPVWTAAGGPITARSAAIYKTSGGAILCFCLLDTTPADVSAPSGQTFSVQAAAGGILVASFVP